MWPESGIDLHLDTYDMASGLDGKVYAFATRTKRTDFARHTITFGKLRLPINRPNACGEAWSEKTALGSSSKFQPPQACKRLGYSNLIALQPCNRPGIE